MELNHPKNVILSTPNYLAKYFCGCAALHLTEFPLGFFTACG